MSTLLRTMIRPAEQFGPVLAGRGAAAEFREQLQKLAANGRVTVDFEGVLAVSPSFADEFFAKLPPEQLDGSEIVFENVSPSLTAIIEFVKLGRPLSSDNS